MELLLNINFLKCSLNDVCIERIANRKQQNTGSKLTSLKEIHGDSLENTEAATPPAHKVVYGITSVTNRCTRSCSFPATHFCFSSFIKRIYWDKFLLFQFRKENHLKIIWNKTVCTFKAFIVYYYVNNPLHILWPQFYNSYRYCEIQLFSFIGKRQTAKGKPWHSPGSCFSSCCIG